MVDPCQSIYLVCGCQASWQDLCFCVDGLVMLLNRNAKRQELVWIRESGDLSVQPCSDQVRQFAGDVILTLVRSGPLIG